MNWNYQVLYFDADNRGQVARGEVVAPDASAAVVAASRKVVVEKEIPRDAIFAVLADTSIRL